MIYNPHPGLMPLAEAAERFQGRVAFVYPTRWAGSPGGNLLERLLRAGRRLLEYALLAVNIWRARRSQVILVREFSTYYICLTALACLPLMRRVILVVAHNVQAAHNSRLQRRLLVLLARSGARLLCFEDATGCRALLPPSLQRAAIEMLHPVTTRAVATRRAPSADGELTVGFLSDFRPEKRMRGVVETLCGLDLDREKIGVFVGSAPREQAVRDLAGLGAAVGFFDTTSSSGFFGFLSTIHVLVVPYPGCNYRYRTSGLIADACGCGTPVLATDLPVLRAQVMTPAQGGVCVGEECFSSGACLGAALSEIRARWPAYSAGMAANARARSVDVIASSLARLLHEETSPETAREQA